MRRLVAVVPAAALLLIASPAQASTGHFASNGLRCTIIGTPGADVLKGTNGRDVICGRGGNDTIRARGGDDVIDGGGGRDVINGGGGGDRIYGGSGADSENGGGGRDVLQGGAGGDTLLGGGDGDTLQGQDGNDDLDGQNGGDNLDGGDGTNWCTIGAGDVQNRCVYDRTAPVLHEMVAVPSVVDVTNADRPFTIRLHITDDTGVARVSGYSGDASQNGGPTLVSGDRRNGWWEIKGVVRRYSKPGEWGIVASVGDRINRQSWRAEPTGFTVRNSNPDTKAPVITSFTMNKTAVDVRTGDAKVVLTAEVAEDKSGMNDLELALLTPANSYNGAEVQDRFVRVSGGLRGGKWRAEVTIPKGSTGGRWNVLIYAQDFVGNRHLYVGPDVYELRRHETYNNYMPLPSYGRLDVTGRAVDTSAPVLQDVVVDRTSIDTLPRSTTVYFDVTAADAGDGIRQISISVIDPVNWVELQGTAFREQPLAGTANAGTWRVGVTFPQGTSPGAYQVAHVSLWDGTNHGFYATPVSRTQFGGDLLAPEHYRTAAGAAWDGTITVIDNPAG